MGGSIKVMRRTVNAYYVGSIPTLPATFMIKLITSLTFIVVAAISLTSCLRDNQKEEITYIKVGELEGCPLYRVKVSGMPPHLIMKCESKCTLDKLMR